MNRTMTLLMTVAASTLLLGPDAGPARAQTAAAPGNADAADLDPKVQQAVDAIWDILDDVDQQRAMSLREITAKSSGLEATIVAQALGVLEYRGLVTKIDTTGRADDTRWYWRTTGNG